MITGTLFYFSSQKHEMFHISLSFSLKACYWFDVSLCIKIDWWEVWNVKFLFVFSQNRQCFIFHCSLKTDSLKIRNNQFSSDSNKMELKFKKIYYNIPFSTVSMDKKENELKTTWLSLKIRKPLIVFFKWKTILPKKRNKHRKSIECLESWSANYKREEN